MSGLTDGRCHRHDASFVARELSHSGRGVPAGVPQQSSTPSAAADCQRHRFVVRQASYGSAAVQGL